MTRAFLKPTTSIPLPDGSPWPAEGKDVEVDRYVRRRLRDGDLVKAEPPAETPATEEAEPPAAEPAAIEGAPEPPAIEPPAKRRGRAQTED